MYACCFNLTSPGKPSELNDRCNPDWVPSLNMGYDSTSTAQIASCHSRFIRLQQRGRVKVSSIHSTYAFTVFLGELHRKPPLSLNSYLNMFACHSCMYACHSWIDANESYTMCQVRQNM